MFKFAWTFFQLIIISNIFPFEAVQNYLLTNVRFLTYIFKFLNYLIITAAGGQTKTDWKEMKMLFTDDFVISSSWFFSPCLVHRSQKSDTTLAIQAVTVVCWSESSLYSECGAPQNAL